MSPLDTVRSALDTFRTNKLRTALTLVGMIIGVFAIIVSVTAVDVIRVYFEESLNVLGPSTFSIQRYPAIQMGDDEVRNRRPLTYDQALELESRLRMPLTISPSADNCCVAVRYGLEQTDPNIFVEGSDEDFLSNFGFNLAEGRNMTGQDVRYNRNVVLLGADVAEDLFVNESPLGKSVRIGGTRYQVIGVLAKKGSFLGFSFDQRVVLPVTTFLQFFGTTQREIESVSIRAGSPGEVMAATEHVIGIMRAIRKDRPGEPNDFEIETNDTIQGTFLAFTAALTVGGAAIGLISLIAAGVGIMNIMLVSVTERTREIGIRKSVGARRRDILRQFLVEAIFLCQFGGLLGIALGGLAGNAVAVFFHISAAFPVGWAVGGLVMVTVIAVVFGGYPALKAARLDPIESLRYE